MKKIALGAAVALVLGFAGIAQASDPVGIYALVEKVVLEPNEATPERIQVWGTFAVAKKGSRDEYEAPARGYMYFTVPTGKESVARKEWADLKKIAGTGQCVAFGARTKDMQTVRKATDKPELAEPYPLGFGLEKLEGNRGMAKKLKDFKPN